MAFDEQGNLFFTDLVNRRIRKIDTFGVITSIAGESFCAADGDGGPALEARLAYADGLAFDARGNLYFTEFGGNRVRMIDPEGITTTVAGTGHEGFAGDGGPAGEAQLGDVTGIALAPNGDLYLTDTTNFRTRRIAISELSG